MSNLLRSLMAGLSRPALRRAHEAAEIARLKGIANEAPPPGTGWRCGDQDSEGKWTVWSGPRKVAAFWDAEAAQEWARQMNTDKTPPLPVFRDDGAYCVECGSHETSESLTARGYVSCCPTRRVIPEVWHVTDGPLATGHFHLWKPAVGLESIDTDNSWRDRANAQNAADERNLDAYLDEGTRAAVVYEGTPHGRGNLFYDDAPTAGAVRWVALMDERIAMSDTWFKVPREPVITPGMREMLDALGIEPEPRVWWGMDLAAPRDLGHFDCAGNYRYRKD